MNKIIAKALESAKPTTENMLAIINLSNNPRVTAEMLLGIYEKPEISDTCKCQQTMSTYHDIKFMNYDDMLECVNYSYYKINFKHNWVPINESLALDMSNVVSEKMFEDDAAKELNMTMQEFRQKYQKIKTVASIGESLQTDSMSLKRWNTGQR